MTTIDDVVARMHKIDAALPKADGVACFNRMYLEVTELVRTRLAAGFFQHAALMTRLDVIFAGLYFAAVDAADAGRPVPEPWAPLVASRHHTHILPVQFALAGMNAHINHDLALAVFTTCQQAKTTPDHIHADYRRINELLASVEEPVRESFLTGVAGEVDRDLNPVIHVVDSWSIEKARDAAWANAQALWSMRALDTVRALFLDALGRMVGFASRALLVPAALP
jgi:uncharacterized protein DUF5995